MQDVYASTHSVMVIKDEPDDELDDEALLFVVDINVGKRRNAVAEFTETRLLLPPARVAASAPPNTHKTAINPIQFERIFILVPLLISIYYIIGTQKRKAKISGQC